MKNREAVVRDELAATLRKDGYVQVEKRVPLNCEGGRRRQSRSIDIYAQIHKQSYIIEVKQASRYHHALGQLMAYLALCDKEAELIMVLYGTPWELRCYGAEAKQVLTHLSSRYKMKITLKLEPG